MSNNKNKSYNNTTHVIRMLKWANENQESWQLICTPENEGMTPCRMKKIISQLAEEEIFEPIFVMLYIHRGKPFVNTMLAFLTTYMISTRWKNEKKRIIKDMMNLLEQDK